MQAALPIFTVAAALIFSHAVTPGESIQSLCDTESADVKSGKWKVTLDEEFEGFKLNASLWTARYTSEVGHATDQEYYVPENVMVEDGYLLLVSRRQNYRGHNYTSGWLDTNGKAYAQYGRVCVRAKIPSNEKGFWPAHWMMPRSETCWPGAGEVDILEMLNGDGITRGTYHYSQFYAKRACNGTSMVTTSVASFLDASFGDAFHEYAVSWTPHELTFHVDGKPYMTSYPADVYKDGVPRVPMYLILNSALGGWAGAVDNTTTLPITHIVDYVRILQDTTESQSEAVFVGADSDLTPEEEEMVQSPIGEFSRATLDVLAQREQRRTKLRH